MNGPGRPSLSRRNTPRSRTTAAGRVLRRVLPRPASGGFLAGCDRSLPSACYAGAANAQIGDAHEGNAEIQRPVLACILAVTAADSGLPIIPINREMHACGRGAGRLQSLASAATCTLIILSAGGETAPEPAAPRLIL